jgi:hypothetical protein
MSTAMPRLWLESTPVPAMNRKLNAEELLARIEGPSCASYSSISTMRSMG